MRNPGQSAALVARWRAQGLTGEQRPQKLVCLLTKLLLSPREDV